MRLMLLQAERGQVSLRQIYITHALDTEITAVKKSLN